MQSALGDLIRERRERRGWDQADLARELGGVTQQTVSRWERGGSRPRRDVVARLAALLQVDSVDLLADAGYGPFGDRPEDVPLPIRPRATVLPVAELSSDRLEEFVADVARRMYPHTHVSRFGGQGHTQYGFDVVAQAGTAFPAGFQCKRRRQFGPKDVRAAVRETALEVEHPFIVLTRVASPDCRVEITKHAGWTLWDVEDLSREVRALPLDEAVRVVDTYFPGWREALLGVAEPGPWLRPDEFFRAFASSSIYTHDWRLVGRSDELAGVLKFLKAEDRIGCLIGRGGIGKSRFLREVAAGAEAAEIAVRFVATGADLKPEHFELLPSSGPLLVAIDDAHERSDLVAFLRALGHRNANAHVLLALRPYGLGLLARDLRHVGLHPTDLPTWELHDLTAADAEALATQALGAEVSDAVVRRLAQLTADCPLITVVAGVLIQRGQLDPGCLDHEDTVRTEVLRAFRDVLVADPLSADAGARRAVLDAVSLLQPFRSDEPSFQTTLSNLVGVPYDRTVVHLKGLEDAGVLLRRGSALRVVPDLLGDVVLAEACFDERSGASTGYLERSVELAETALLQNIFINASRVDWQIRHDRADAPGLTQALWDQVNAEFEGAGILGRRRLLELLRRVGHFAPEPTLALVRRAIANPTDAVDEVSDLEAAFLRRYPPTYNDVLQELPPLLRGAGYHFAVLPEVLDILWELAKGDDRPPNQYPYHALRVLRDLAELELGKPLAYNHAVIDAATRWLEEPIADSEHSPFDVLEPMLATEGLGDHARGHTLIFKPFVLTPVSVASLRERILDLAFETLSSADARVAVRAVHAIAHGLRYPHGYFGQDVDESERDAWTPEFLRILDRLASAVAQTNPDPVVVIAIRQAIRWHADHSRTETRDAARRVRQTIPGRPEDELAMALFDGWGQLSEGRERDFEKARDEREERARALAVALATARTDGEIIEVIEERLIAQKALGHGSGSSGPFVWALVSTRPSFGMAVADRLTTCSTSPLLGLLPVALAGLAEHAPTDFVPVITRLLDNGDIEVRRQVAHALGWNRGARASLLPGESELLAQLAVDTDVFTRTCVVRAAQRLVSHHPDAATRLLYLVPFADSSTVADAVFQVFGPHGELDWRQLPLETMKRFLDELEQCPSIEDYWITAFLSDFSSERPEDLVELLQCRVDRWQESDSDTEYHALPFNWDNNLRVRESSRFELMLRRLRDWLAAQPDSWRRQDAGADLFAAVAGAFDKTVIRVLAEGAGMGDDGQMVAVGSILRKAPRTFVFDNVEFVRRVLGFAAQLGEEQVQRVGDALAGAVISGGRTGVAGKPFAEDIEQRDRAREVAGTLPTGSPEQRLYRSLGEWAEYSIKWHSDQDEKMDGRDW